MREYIAHLFALGMIVTMIPGCFSKQNKISKAALPQKQAAFSFENLQTNIDVAAGSADQLIFDPVLEAKLHDIPTMVGSAPVECSPAALPEGQLMQAWVSPYDQTMVANFYSIEMESGGWQKLAIIKGFETMLVFQKPKRICAISIRSLSGTHKNIYTCLIHISMSSKEK